MADDLRISTNEIKKRMQAGEKFTIIDARNPHTWAESDEMARGAMRVPADALETAIERISPDDSILIYCT